MLTWWPYPTLCRSGSHRSSGTLSDGSGAASGTRSYATNAADSDWVLVGEQQGRDPGRGRDHADTVQRTRTATGALQAAHRLSDCPVKCEGLACPVETGLVLG